MYSLVETATLNDHIIDLKEHHVELFPGKTSEIVLENHKRPNLYVYKNDADDGTAIENTGVIVRRRRDQDGQHGPRRAEESLTRRL